MTKCLIFLWIPIYGRICKAFSKIFKVLLTCPEVLIRPLFELYKVKKRAYNLFQDLIFVVTLNLRIMCHLERLDMRNSFIFEPSKFRLWYLTVFSFSSTCSFHILSKPRKRSQVAILIFCLEILTISLFPW